MREAIRTAHLQRARVWAFWRAAKRAYWRERFEMWRRLG